MRAKLVILVTLFIADSILTSYSVLGVPLRLYIALMTIFVALIGFKKKETVNLKFFYHYLLIVFVFISSYLLSDIKMITYISRNISIIAIAVLMSKVVDLETLEKFFKVVLIFGIVNCIFTILQALQVDVVWKLISYWRPSLQYLGGGFYSYGGEGVNIYPPGLADLSVRNGYYIAMTFPLVYFLRKRKLLFFSSLVLFFVAAFVVQQRSCFYLMCIITFVMTYRLITKVSSRVFFGFIFGIVILSYTLVELTLSETRLTQTSDPERLRSLMNTKRLFYENTFTGGFKRYISYFGTDNSYLPHNDLLNAFIFAGVIGFILLILFYGRLVKFLYRNVKSNDPIIFAVSLGIFGFIGSSMFHNLGFTLGSYQIWWLILPLTTYIFYQKQRIQTL
jgi:hypothetical protein